MLTIILLCFRLVTSYTSQLLRGDPAAIEPLMAQDQAQDGVNAKKLFLESPDSTSFMSLLVHLSVTASNLVIDEIKVNEQGMIVPKTDSILNNAYLRLLSHLLQWSQKLGRVVSFDTLTHMNTGFLSSAIVELMLRLFDVRISGNPLQPSFVEDGKSFSDVVDLKMLALLNGDFFIEGLRLGDKSAKIDEQGDELTGIAKLKELEGGNIDEVLKTYLYLFKDAEGKPDFSNINLSELKRKFRFAALIKEERRNTVLLPLHVLGRMLIREMPRESELLFPLSSKGHAMMISFDRTKDGLYGFKIYNSGDGIGHHMSVELADGRTKYSPFLAFKEISWGMLEASNLIRRFLENDLTTEMIYTGLCGQYILNERHWLYEDYVAHANALDKTHSDVPRLIITQRSGTCTNGAIKAFMIANLSTKTYRLLNQYLKIDQALSCIKAKARVWILANRGKEDARFTLRHLVRNVARRTMRLKLDRIAEIKACLKVIEGIPTHKPAARKGFELKVKSLMSISSRPSHQPAKLAAIPVPDLRATITTLKGMTGFIQQMKQFLETNYLEVYYRKVFVVRILKELPHLSLDTLGRDNPVEKRSQIIKILYLILSLFRSTFNWDIRGLSFNSFRWELWHLRMLIHHYAKISEQYYFMWPTNRQLPSFTLENCAPDFTADMEDYMTMDFQARSEAASQFKCFLFCASFKQKNGRDVWEGKYPEAMYNWYQGVPKEEFEQLQTLPTELIRCMEENLQCNLTPIIQSIPSYKLEFYFFTSLEYFVFRHQLPEPFEITTPDWKCVENPIYKGKATSLLSSTKSLPPYSEEGLSLTSLTFSSTLQLHQYLAEHDLRWEAVNFLLKTTVLTPQTTEHHVCHAVIAFFTNFRNAIDLATIYEPFKRNIYTTIDSINAHFDGKLRSDIYDVVQLYTVLLYFEIQRTLQSDGNCNGIRQLIERLQRDRISFKLLNQSGMLATHTDSLGTIDMLILACYRTILDFHGRKNLDDAQIADDLLEFAKVFKALQNVSYSELVCEDYVMHHANLCLTDLLKNAKFFKRALRTNQTIVHELIKLEAGNNLLINDYNIDPFPIILYNGNVEWNLFFKIRQSLTTTEKLTFTPHTQSFLVVPRGSLNSGSKVIFEDHKSSGLPVVYHGNEVYYGSHLDEKQIYLSAVSDTKSILIGRDSKEIWLEWDKEDREIKTPNWLPNSHKWHYTDIRASRGTVQSVQQCFKFVSLLKVIGIAMGPWKRPTVFIVANRVLIRRNAPEPLVIQRDGNTLYLLPYKPKQDNLLTYQSDIRVKGAADMEKYPIFCRTATDDCKMLMPGMKRDSYLIPLQQTKGTLYEFAPQERIHTLLLVYRLIRAFLFNLAYQFAAQVNFKDKFTMKELGLLNAILKGEGRDPEFIAIATVLTKNAKGRLRRDEEAERELARNKECPEAKLCTEKVYNELEYAFLAYRDNMDDELKDRIEGLRSIILPKFTGHSLANALQLTCPKLELNPKGDKELKSILEERASANLITRFLNRKPHVNSFSPESIAHTDRFLEKLANDGTISTEELRPLMDIFNGDLESLCTIDGYFKERMSTFELPSPNLILPPKPLTHPSPTLPAVLNSSANSSATQMEPNVKEVLQSPNLEEKLLEAKAGSLTSAENLVKSWAACLRGDQRELKAIGYGYHNWLLLYSGAVDEVVDRVKDCIARQDMTCVRDKLACEGIEDSFMKHAVSYLGLSFVANYYEKRYQKLSAEDQQFELERANDVLGTGRFLTWQHATSYVLTKIQYEDVVTATKLDNGSYPEIILQRVMASGKTFTLGPLITNGKADGYHLPVLIVPTALFESNSDDLLRRQQLFFGQRGMALRFERISNFAQHENLVELLREMIALINERGYIVAAPEAIQAMENSFIEMLDPTNSVSQLTFDTMRTILRLIRSRGAATFDEIDTIFNPRKELNYPIGESEQIEKVYVYMSALLHYILQKNPTASSAVLLATFKAMADKEPWASVLAPLSKLQENFLLTSPRMKDTPADGKREHYLIMWQQLNEWIPDGKKSVLNFNFGRSVEYPNYWMAKPFKGAKVPSEESEFSNPFETLNKTFAMYFSIGIDVSQLDSFFWYTIQNAKDLTTTKGLFGITGTIDLKENKRQMVSAFNKQLLNPVESMHTLALTSLLNYLSIVAIPRDLQYYRKSIKSNALSMAKRFKTIMGYSGTLPNKFIFPEPLRKGIKWDLKAIEDIKNVMREDQNKEVRVVQKAVDLVSLVTSIAGSYAAEADEMDIDGAPEPLKPRALIDIGAMFKDYSNREVAEELLSQWQHLTTILYYDPKTNKIVAVKRGEPNPLQTHGTEWEKLKEALNLSFRSEYGVFFDQWHTTGTDIPLPTDAQGIATVGLSTTDRDLTQGVMRMRKFLRGQSVKFVVEAAVSDKLGQPSVGEIIKYTEAVAAEMIKRENLQVAFAKLQNEMRASILDTLLDRPQLTTEAVYSVYDQISPFLVSTEAEINEAYGGELKNVPSLDVIRPYANWLKGKAMDLYRNGRLVDYLLVNRLTELLRSIEKVATKNRLEKEMTVRLDGDRVMGTGKGTAGGEQQRVNIQLNQQIGDRQLDGANKAATYESFPWLAVQFGDRLEMSASYTGYLAALKVGLNVKNGATLIRDLAKQRSKQNCDCIDERIAVTLDFAIVLNTTGKRLEIAPWQSFQKPLQMLLWIENGADQRLVICTPNDALSFIAATKKKTPVQQSFSLWNVATYPMKVLTSLSAGNKPPNRIALIDLKGTVYHTSDPSAFPLGTTISNPLLHQLLKQVYILFGSYPMLKQSNYDDVKRDQVKIKCFSGILGFSLQGNHRVAFLNDRDLWKVFRMDRDAIYQLQSGKQAEVPTLAAIQRPNNAVSLGSKNLMDALYYRDVPIDTTQQISWEQTSKIIAEVYNRLLMDRRMVVEQLEIVCDTIMSKAQELANHPKTTANYAIDRKHMASSVQHVINIRSLVELIKIAKQLPIKVRRPAPIPRKENRSMVLERVDEDREEQI